MEGFFSLPFFGLGLKCKYQKHTQKKKKVLIFLIHSTLKKKRKKQWSCEVGKFSSFTLVKGEILISF